MIVINIKIADKVMNIVLPATWDEMKVRHYLALETTKNPLEILALFSDIPLSDILNTKTDLKPVIESLIKLLSSDVPDFKKKPRRPLVIDGKTIKMPTDFNKITFGQSAMIETHLAGTDGDERKAIPQIMGVILQPLLDKGDFDLDRADYYATKAGELSILDAFPNVFFFWTVLIEYIVIGAVNLTLSPTPTR